MALGKCKETEAAMGIDTSSYGEFGGFVCMVAAEMTLEIAGKATAAVPTPDFRLHGDLQPYWWFGGLVIWWVGGFVGLVGWWVERFRS